MKTRKNRFAAILMLVCTLTGSIFAQQIQVSGIVTDAQTHDLKMETSLQKLCLHG